MAVSTKAVRLLARVTDGLSRRIPTLSPLNQGFPLGFLSSWEVEKYVGETYAAAPTFYDPESYTFNHEHTFFAPISRHTQGKRLLDLYCGHGREAEIFAEEGFEVCGVERMPSSVKSACTRSAELKSGTRFICADISTWEPPEEETWDIVYTSLWMLSTVADRSARIAWLRRLSNWVPADGILVASVTTRRPECFSEAIAKWARLSGNLCSNSRRVELGDRLTQGLFWHDYGSGEVEEEAEDAGLRILESFSFREDSRGYIFTPHGNDTA